MDPYAWVDDRFGDSGEHRGGELYLPLALLPTIIDALTEAQIAITGFEGFRLTPSATCPSMQHIAQGPPQTAGFWADHVVEANSFARSVVAEWQLEADAMTHVALVLSTIDDP